MGDQNNSPVTAGEGQPPQSSQPAPAEQPEQQTEFITRTEVERLTKKAEENAFRRAQSLQNKGEQRVKERIAKLESTFEAQEAAGVEIPDNVKDNLRRQEESKARAEVYEQGDEADPSSHEPASQPAAQPEGGAPVLPQGQNPQALTAWGLMNEAGVFIDDNDPEVASIDLSTTGAAIKTVQAAIAAKKERTNSPQPATPRTPTGAGTSGAKAAPNPLTMNKKDLWDKAKNDF